MDTDVYRPLPTESIRLLHLEPASTLNAPLIGSLVPAALQDGLDFEALSYTWGDPLLAGSPSPYESPYNQIRYKWVGMRSLPGRLSLKEGTIAIGGNLCSALVHIRSTTEVKTLWVDAVCIDQSNDAEKSTQVAMMARIYATATRVIVWLGNDSADRDGELFFRLCRKRYRMMENPWCGAWRKALWPMLRAYNRYFYSTVANCTWQLEVAPFFCRSPSKRFSQLALFRSREYFNRRWCIQELALARDVIMACGAHRLPWKMLEYVHDRDFRQRSGGLFVWSSWLTDWDDPIDRIRKLRTDEVDMFMLLGETMSLKCSDDRDTIYALASILGKDKLCPTINIDYTFTPNKVKTDFTASLIATGDLSITWRVLLSAADQYYEYYAAHDYDRELPSWVPDWSDFWDFHHGRSVMRDNSEPMLGRGTVHNRSLAVTLAYFGTVGSFQAEGVHIVNDRWPDGCLNSDHVYGLPEQCYGLGMQGTKWAGQEHPFSSYLILRQEEFAYVLTIRTIIHRMIRSSDRRVVYPELAYVVENIIIV